MEQYYFSDIKQRLMVKESAIPYGYICSPMNYIGGKYKLLSQILPLFPKRIHTFVDLFCGGCNVGINVNADRVIFNDNISYLIDLYNSFNNLEKTEIIEHIESRINQYQLSKTNDLGYKELRVLYNRERNPLDLFVLVAYSFNHQIRFNNSHEYNNPFGKERSSFNSKMRNNLSLFLDILQEKNVEFVCSNFDKFNFDDYNQNDFVYCDPPYLITTGTYNDGKRGFTGWTKKEEKNLLRILSELNNKNIKFALSNVLKHKGESNDILMEWITRNNFYVVHLNKDYSNSNYQTKNNNITDEVLITNYRPIQDNLNS